MLPTIGTALIISAGSGSWVNRVILSNSHLVWFGLISYPLYLWHWPTLTFARIIESGTPSLPIRISAVLISILLAWFTYSVIERPLRFVKNEKFIFNFLIIAIFIMGSMGYLVYTRNGIIYKNKIKDIGYAIQETEQSFKDKCSQKITNIPVNNCADVGDKNNYALIIGDSHVRPYYEILKSQIIDSNLGVVAITTGGCPFLIDTLVSTNKECAEKNAAIYEFIKQNDHKIRVILLAGEYSYYAVPGVLKSSDGVDISFTNALQKTLQHLDRRKIIFLDQIPPVPFNPRKCLNRPYTISDRNFDCRSNRDEVAGVLIDYKEKKEFVTTLFPGLYSFNVDSVLCDDVSCRVMSDNNIFYYDKTHLNPNGVSFISSRIKFKHLLQHIIAEK